MVYSAEEKNALLRLARLAVIAVADGNAAPDPTAEVSAFPNLLTEDGCGAFVTLHSGQRLRGCIGLMTSPLSLAETVAEMGRAAASEDPRFPAVRSDELNAIWIEISILSPLERVGRVEDIQVGLHGIMVKQGKKSGVFLPQVAVETGWDRERFLREVCKNKAGIAENAWQDPKTEIYRFTAEIIAEEHTGNKSKKGNRSL